MVVNKQTTLFSGATTTGSATVGTYGSDSASIQVDGVFTGLSLKVQGRLFGADSWEDMAVVNLKDFSVCQTVSAKGVYSFAVDSYYEVRVSITAIASGSVTVLSQSTAVTKY